MELKEGYKQTEVGAIPDDWVVKPLKDLGVPVRGGSPRPAGDRKYFNGSYIPWLTVAALTTIPDSQILVSETASCLTQEGSLQSRTLMPGTLILANSGATLGIAKIIGIKCCANDGIAALLNLNQNINPYYLANLINTKTRYLREIVATGNGQPNLNTTLIGNFKVPCPPTFAEQTAIANALSDADALIQSLTRLIAKKRQIKQGAMQTLLNPYENGRLKEGWDMITYGEAFTFLSTASFSRSELISNGEYEYIHYGDIHTLWHGHLDFNNNSAPAISAQKAKGYALVKDGDLVMADASEDYEGIGKSVEIVGIENKKVISGLHTFLLRDSKKVCVNRYRGYIHSSEFVKKQFDRLATGLKVYGISKAKLKTVAIPLPPREEQTRITTILSEMDTEIAALESKLAKYQQIKLGMMQNLLTGRIRLVTPETKPQEAA